ncbi:porin [Methylorubrum aminovorans]|uniref:porin n=1 Tax=Methylorubrum aminovorans TaxID=269069 RepID=UPI003C2B33F9
MKLVKSLLLGSAAGLTIVGGAQAADLPVKKAAPIEYVRVCTAYGAGFFYIPGTDTCLRISGRARAEYGYIGSDNRRVTGGGDLSGFVGLARFAFDTRTQTGYGTLRAFLRVDMASRTGHTKLSSGTNLRGGYAFSGTGQDAFGRIQNFVNVDKAFIQFAGLTAGRASSFYDFYAADYEIIGSSLGSNMPSTNLLAYTQKFGDGWTATISMEDPNYRKNPLFTNAIPAAGAAAGTGALSQVLTTAPTPIILGTDALGNATSVAFIDAVQRSRLPDFVGSLRYDAPWGSAQLSAAVREINVGGFISSVGVPGGSAANAQALLAARGLGDGVQTEYGWAVQGGVKFNLPFIAPGDGLYLQGSYGEGTSFYTGINRFTAGYLASASVYAGNPFNQYLADAVVNPLSGRIELSSSFTAVASYLHYWSPEWRSAFYASYGEIWFPTGARQATSQANALVNSGNTVAPGSYLTNPVGYATSQSLRDTYQIVTGASLIWSPVKDLDIGVEGQYIRTGVKGGRVADQDKGGFIGAGNAQVPTRTVSSEDVFQARFRVQRDF